MRIAIIFLATLACSAAVAGALRVLGFEDRVRAQQRIDAVYGAALTGPPPSPETSGPRAEAKVRAALKKSIVLENYWKTPITREALRRELDRIERNTGMGDRLRQLYATLDNDAVLIEEALARPVLADRLTADFFAYDRRIHADALAQATALRTRLATGVRVKDLGGATRTTVELAAGDNGETRALFNAAVRSLPSMFGAPGELQEEATAFTFDVAVELRPDFLRVERYSVPKVAWDKWWAQASMAIDEAAVLAEAAVPISGESPARDLVSPGLNCDPGGNWNNGVLGSFPDPRFGHTAVWTGTEMIVWGGFDYADAMRTGGRYDPLTDTWRKIPVTGAPSRRYGHLALWTGTEMIVWGGWDSSEGPAVPLGDGSRYDPATDSWHPISTSGAPAAGPGYTAVWTGTQMVLWNGTGGRRYNPATDTWSGITTSGAPAGGKAVWAGTAMIVWGSAGGGRYNPASDSWTPISTSGAPALAAPPLVWTGSAVIAWGGGFGGIYTPATDSWRPMAPHDAHGSVLIWTGTAFLVGPTALGPIEKYDPASDTWSPLADGYEFPNGPSAVWTGTYLILWGGATSGGGRPLNTGERYDLAANTWTSTGTNGGPRYGGDAILATPLGMIDWNGYNFTGIYDLTLDAWHAVGAPVSGGAVCTGSEVIWWDGTSGGRLDLLDDSWTSIPADGPPSYSTFLWTGQNVLAWEPHGGATFDPVANAWAPVPGYEIGGTAVWAGDQLIVYGPTGGVRLNPATSTWQPVSSVGAPTIGNSAVISTGNAMVVWGGQDSGGPTNAGAVYYPATNTWRAMSLTNAPSARSRFGSAWTGREVVIWGGSGLPANHSFGTGGRYDPASDRWTSIALGDAPIPREGNTVVWTGHAAIVWGGSATSDWVNPLNTGGRLFLDTLYDNDGDGLSECSGDCDDTQASIYPGAAEVCNGVDDNCDGQVDEDLVGLDTDGDGVHNACDNCRFTANADQSDVDADNVGDICDNCRSDYNPAQSDFDHDGEGDMCDVNDGLIYLRGTGDNGSIGWQHEAGPASWNVYAGDLGVLRATGAYTEVPGSNPLAEKHCGVTALAASVLELPDPGSVQFMLVTGVTGGIEGSLGTNGAGVERANTNPCP